MMLNNSGTICIIMAEQYDVQLILPFHSEYISSESDAGVHKQSQMNIISVRIHT